MKYAIELGDIEEESCCTTAIFDGIAVERF
jgi:hypothetical protein